MYKKFDTYIQDTENGKFIPLDPENSDYSRCMEMVAQGAAMENCESTVVDARAAMWVRIKAERDLRQAGGVKVGAHWFHSDANSRIQQLALVMLGANIPQGVQWKTMSGEMVLMTQQLAGQIFAAEAASDIAIFAHAEALRAAVDVSNDPASVDIDAVTDGQTFGWPPVYEAAP